MATRVKLRPLPKDIWDISQVEGWRAEEECLHAFLRANGARQVLYPNGVHGWEGSELKLLLKQYAEENGLSLEWEGGNPTTASTATLTKRS